jgi:hypothetical protein
MSYFKLWVIYVAQQIKSQMVNFNVHILFDPLNVHIFLDKIDCNQKTNE